MKIGARNQLVGKVTEISKGAMMCKVKVEVATPASMCSVMTIESLDELGISEGDAVSLIAKAVNVLVMTQ